MKKAWSMIICTSMLLSLWAVSALAFGIDPAFQVDGQNVSTLSGAFAKAVSGSVIQQTGGDKTVYLAEENIDVTADVTLIGGKSFGDTFRRIEYSGTDKPLFTVRSGGKLTLRFAEFRLIDTDVAGRGKMIVVEAGGLLVLDGTEAEPVTFLDSSDSTGLILVKRGGRLVFFGASLAGDESGDMIKVEDGGAVIGDLNGDRVINGADYFRMRAYLDSPETVPVSVSPDCNRDGNVNVTDLSLLLKFLAERTPGPDDADLSDKSAYQVSVSPDKSVQLRFTPKESASLTFVLPADEGTKLWYILYDENGELISHAAYGYDENVPANGTFEISADFCAGREYDLEIGTAAEGPVEFQMNVPLAQPEAEAVNDSPAGSVLSEGNPWIVLVISVLAIAGVAALVIAKKKKIIDNS